MEKGEEEDVETAVVMILMAIVECRRLLPEERRRFRALTAETWQETRGAREGEPAGTAMLQ